jgi:hypothetical protein
LDVAREVVVRERWLDTVLRGVLVGLACLAAACDGNGTPDGGQDGDGGQCPTLCSSGEECCSNGCGGGCVDGICVEASGCTGGCNSECDKAAGEVCDPSTKCCIPGTPPPTCQVDCNCYSGEVCEQGTCTRVCVSDPGCPADEMCRDGRCRPVECTTREDCAGGADCLTCVDQQCVAELSPCTSSSDCCLPRCCRWGICQTECSGCGADSDCVDWSRPVCVDGMCVPECVEDADCGAGEVCLEGSCVLEDCCGNVCTADEQTCDPFTCQCADPCWSQPSCQLGTPPTCCPQGFACDTGDRRCRCSEAGCPPGAICDPISGACQIDPGACGEACVAPAVCLGGGCRAPGTGLDGDPCFTDAHCDGSQGLLCDGSIFCRTCYQLDPTYSPAFVCRLECSLAEGTCTNPAYTCKLRHMGLKGLCVPEEVP